MENEMSALVLKGYAGMATVTSQIYTDIQTLVNAGPAPSGSRRVVQDSLPSHRNSHR